MSDDKELLPTLSPLLQTNHVLPTKKGIRARLIYFFCALFTLFNMFSAVVFVVLANFKCSDDEDPFCYPNTKRNKTMFFVGLLVIVCSSATFFAIILSSLFEWVLKDKRTVLCIRVSCLTQFLALLFVTILLEIDDDPFLMCYVLLIGFAFNVITTIVYYKAIEY